MRMFSGTLVASFKFVSHRDMISYLKIELCTSSKETLWKSFLLRVFRFQLQKEKKLLLKALTGALIPLVRGPVFFSISIESNINSKNHRDTI